jgi:hypothetical protein
MYNTSIAPVGIVVLLQKYPRVCLPTGLAPGDASVPLPEAKKTDACALYASSSRGDGTLGSRAGSSSRQIAEVATGEERRESEGPRTVARRRCWHNPSTPASA